MAGVAFVTHSTYMKGEKRRHNDCTVGCCLPLSGLVAETAQSSLPCVGTLASWQVRQGCTCVPGSGLKTNYLSLRCWPSGTLDITCSPVGQSMYQKWAAEPPSYKALLQQNAPPRPVSHWRARVLLFYWDWEQDLITWSEADRQHLARLVARVTRPTSPNTRKECLHTRHSAAHSVACSLLVT